MLQPVQDKIVLKIKKEEEVTKGGILLSGSTHQQVLLATVVAVGPGMVQGGERLPMEVKENQLVYVEKNLGIPLEHEGEEYLVVTQKDILAIVTDGKECL